MKRKKWVLVLLIVAFLLTFWQYKIYDALSTDREIPQIAIADAKILEISVHDPKSALLQGVAASDEQDGDLTERLVVEDVQLMDDSGLIEVSYAVADNSGNVAKATRQVKYTDYDSPKFILTEPLIYEEHETFDVMSVIHATDVLDGDIQHRIRATTLTEESISSVGTHRLYFQVTNSIGDTSELTVPLEVLDTGRYEADLTLTDYLIYLPVGSDFQAKNYLGEFVHRNKTVSLRDGLPEDFSVSISSDVSTGTEGVYTVTYKVSYTVRNEQNSEYDQKFTGYSRLIVVVEG
jgi:hypothetical protein